tara:strand:- start:152 stop:1048 length:897 start_codon:yes stop_codon:yes gene_type:complete
MDTFWRLVLIIAHEPFIIVFLTFGYLCLDRKIFGKTLCLLLISLAVNPLLKNLFQVPLHPSLGRPGFGFPSGHMQSAVVLWGWLAWEYKKPWIYAGVTALLACIGYATVRAQYHYPADIIGAVGFGLILLVLFHYFTASKSTKRHEQLCTGGILGSMGPGMVGKKLLQYLTKTKLIKARIEYLGFRLLPISILLYLATPHHAENPYLCLGFSGLFGMGLGWVLTSNLQLPPRRWTHRIPLFIFGLCGAIAIHYGAIKFSTELDPRLLVILKYSLTALWISGLAPWLFLKGKARLKIGG